MILDSQRPALLRVKIARTVLLAVLLVAGPGAACGFLRGSPVVLVLSVDTLRADHVGAYGNPGLTPNLDRLAAESLVFDHAYATVPFTLPSLAALMTSRYPEEVGIDDNLTTLPKDTATLAAFYAGRGYRTGAVVSNFVLRARSGFSVGFERYDATLPQREAVRPIPERVAPSTTKAALAMIDTFAKEGRRPLFLWVHYQDPHGPYTPPEGLRERYQRREQGAPDADRTLPVSKGQSGAGGIPRYQFFGNHHEPSFYRAGYDGEVSYVDAGIGALLDGLRDRGLMRNTTIVFLADHGEGLGEGDYWFAHGERLTDALVRVPLFLRVPGHRPGRRVDVASLLDVFPTLAALAGGAPPAGARGRDLLAPEAASGSSTVYLTSLAMGGIPRYGLVDRGYKYVVTMHDGRPQVSLTRLGEERIDLASTEVRTCRALGAELASARGRLRRARSSRQILSPEDIEKLESLGYVEGR